MRLLSLSENGTEVHHQKLITLLQSHCLHPPSLSLTSFLDARDAIFSQHFTLPSSQVSEHFCIHSTTDWCNPGSGCQYSTVDCNDGNACTKDICDNLEGCIFLISNKYNSCKYFNETVENACISTFLFFSTILSILHLHFGCLTKLDSNNPFAFSLSLSVNSTKHPSFNPLQILTANKGLAL